MPTKQPNNWQIFGAAIITAAAGSFGGPVVMPEWFRPDPYTSEDADRTRNVVDYRLQSHEDRLMMLELDVATMGSDLGELPPPSLLERINELERDVHLLKALVNLPSGP